MSRGFLIVVSLFLGSIVASFCSPIYDVPGFLYLGSTVTHNGSNFVESDYYLSAISGEWSRADGQCKSIFAPNGNTLAIESDEEQMFINKQLQFNGVRDTIFWTSGQYDVAFKLWRWAANGEEIQWLNWGDREPTMPIVSASRIAFVFNNEFNSYWMNAKDSIPHRYICELNNPTQEP